MKNRFLYIAINTLLVLSLTKCAQVGPLNGGARDTKPPKLVEAIPDNKNTGFNAGVITLKFDEYIRLQDLSNQLIITPKFKTVPEITADGKKLQILLKREDLLPNTTYRFFFGSSIIDMNEGNAIPNFEYVFSTGSFVDSLKIKGQVIDAFTNRPISGALVAAYNTKENIDSLPYIITPNYVSKTDENGAFILNYLPYDDFKLFSFLDKNKNNLYDGDIEKIAFQNQTMTLTSDTVATFKLFQEQAPKTFIKKINNPYYGFTQLILNKKSLVALTCLSPPNNANISELNVNKEKDTIAFYYKDLSDSLNLILSNRSSAKTDTLKISLPKNNSAKKRLKRINLNTSSTNLGLNEKIKISFLNWMDTSNYNLTNIKLSSKEDSLIAQKPLKGRWLSVTMFELNQTLQEGINYSLKIDTNSFFDLKGFTNDSAFSKFKTQSKLEFGKVTLKMLFNKKQSYTIQLTTEKGEVIKEKNISFSLSSSNSVSIDFIDVPPGTYTVKVIFDDNENKKWDSGNFLLKQQPEHVFINSKQVKVLSDWEIEEEIVVKE